MAEPRRSRIEGDQPINEGEPRARRCVRPSARGVGSVQFEITGWVRSAVAGAGSLRLR